MLGDYPTDLIVREANTSDIAHILPIWLEFMEFLEEHNPDYWKMVDGEGAFTQHLKNSLENPLSLVAVLEINQNLVGFCLAYIEGLPAWFGADKIGLIRYLAISKDHRQVGLGQKLVSFMLDWFRANGIKRVEVFVLQGIPASGFWGKLGFKEFMDRRFLEI
jgi:ribosomal protein S18 acetylase RimI-like enzyme